MRKNVFIASSKEGRSVAQAIKTKLESDANVTEWEYAFSRTQTVIESLEDVVDKNEVGVFVLQEDDLALRRDKEESIPRDNVIFELGLFIGRRGRQGAFLIVSQQEGLHLPTDLNGINILKYKGDSDYERLSSNLDDACNRILNKIRHMPSKPPSREMLTVVVINKKEEFNNELTNSLYRELFDHKISIRIVEDHHGGSRFILRMQEAARDKPDFLVVVPPSKELANTQEITKILQETKHNERQVIFIENSPDNIDQYKGNVTAIQADSEKGATTLIDHAIDLCKRYSFQAVLLVNGPDYNETAKVRAKIYESKLNEVNIKCELIQSEGWETDRCYRNIYPHLMDKKKQVPDLIICGNDSMALGGVRAIMESPRLAGTERLPLVFGYDGLPSALVQIRESWSPFYATINLSPQTYGEHVAATIRNILDGDSPEICQRIHSINILMKKDTHIIQRWCNLSECKRTSLRT